MYDKNPQYKKEEKRYDKKPDQQEKKEEPAATELPLQQRLFDSKYQDKKKYQLTAGGQASYNQPRIVRPEYVMINPQTMDYHTDPLLAMRNYVKSPPGAFEYKSKATVKQAA